MSRQSKATRTTGRRRGDPLPCASLTRERGHRGQREVTTPAELAAVGKQLDMSLSDDDVKFFLETLGGRA